MITRRDFIWILSSAMFAIVPRASAATEELNRALKELSTLSTKGGRCEVVPEGTKGEAHSWIELTFDVESRIAKLEKVLNSLAGMSRSEEGEEEVSESLGMNDPHLGLAFEKLKELREVISEDTLNGPARKEVALEVSHALDGFSYFYRQIRIPRALSANSEDQRVVRLYNQGLESYRALRSGLYQHRLPEIGIFPVRLKNFKERPVHDWLRVASQNRKAEVFSKNQGSGVEARPVKDRSLQIAIENCLQSQYISCIFWHNNQFPFVVGLHPRNPSAPLATRQSPPRTEINPEFH